MRHDNEVDETALFDAEEFESSDEVEVTREPRRAPRAPRAPGARRDRAFTAAAAVAAVFALLALVLVVLLVRQRDENKADGDRTTVQTTASRVAEALVSVDANGQSGAGTVRELGTGPLVQQFDEANAAVRGTFGPLKITSITGRVKEVYLKEIEGSEADVIVVLDLVIVGENPRVDQDHYLRVHLAKLSGAWKVDNVQDVNLALAGGVSDSGSGAAPTTVPTPAPSTAPAPGPAPPETSS